jgi:AbrB family looped-hinge helix DNA binding protein
VALDLTKLSQKGQLVIPSAVRRQLRLKQGMKFLVVGMGDTIVLRRLEVSEERARMKNLIQQSRKKAAKVGFTEKEINKLIQETRKAI